jgi:hypothetical protein
MQRNLRDSVPVEVKVVPKALLESLVDDYLKVHRPVRIEGRAYFLDQPDFESAIRLSMPADELEDLLCIYKADLKAGKRLDKGGASSCDGARKTGSGSIQSTARSGDHW